MDTPVQWINNWFSQEFCCIRLVDSYITNTYSQKVDGES